MQTAEPGVALEASIAVFDQGAVTVERVRLPERAVGEIDVAISAAAICGSDLHTVLGHRAAPERTALGHEGVGHVTAVDDGVVDLRGRSLRVGDRVVFALFHACGSCDRCASGLSMKCRSLIKYGHESVGTAPYATGTLASQVRLLPGVPVLRIPDEIADVEVVSAGCAVATAAAIVAAAHPLPPGGPEPVARHALVLGAGAVGAYTAAMLASLGCTVWARDPSEARLGVVGQLGAYPDRSPGRSFPLVVEASGSADAFADALHAADVGGRVVAAGSVSPGSSTVTVDPAWVVTRRLSLIGVHNYAAGDFAWGVDWLLTHGRSLGLARLMSPPMALRQVAAAFTEMERGCYPRVLVRPEEPPP